jgi:hypothetical protein
MRPTDLRDTVAGLVEGILAERDATHAAELTALRGELAEVNVKVKVLEQDNKDLNGALATAQRATTELRENNENLRGRLARTLRLFRECPDCPRASQEHASHVVKDWMTDRFL